MSPDIKCETYQPSDEQRWLDLLAEVQIESNAWEAVYIIKPQFALDLCFWSDNQLISILAGHTIADLNTKINNFNIEIFAIAPDHQGKGLAKKVLKTAAQSISGNTTFHLWTVNEKAKSIYEHIGLKAGKVVTQIKTRTEGKVHSFHQTLKLKDDPEGELVEYVYTQDLF